MKAYPEYKDSGVEWVGKLPSHWNVMPLKYAALVNREALTEQVEEDFELQYIDIGNVNQLGLVNPPERMKFIDAPSRARRIIKKNDTIISTVRTYLKAVAFIDRDDDNLIASTGFATLTSLNETHPKYLYYLVSNQGFVDTVSAWSTGVSYPAITATELARIIAWLPSLPEQQAIADFLDHKTAQIDTLIEKKQQQIDLLQEQRTALINHTVTKGLDPDVRMKDSGVEWLGEIPSHWEVSKLKYLVNKIGSGVTPRGGSETYQESGIPFIRSQNVHFDGLRLDDIAFISKEVHESMSNSAIRPNDVLLNITGASIGRCTFVPNDFGEANVNQHVCILRANEKINFQYLNLVLSSTIGQTQVWLGQGGAAREGLNYSNLGNFFVILPPLDEQIAVIERLNSKLSQIDSARKQFQELIGMYQEYRTALISEAVTGKIDVRTAV